MGTTLAMTILFTCGAIYLPPNKFVVFLNKTSRWFKSVCIKMWTCNISARFHSLTEMSPDRNGPDLNGSDRIGKTENWPFWSQILKFCLFLTHLAFFENKKSQTTSGFLWLFFSRRDLALAKHCLNCISIVNFIWRGSVTMMQAAKNIAKIFLLPWKCSV